ncbi:MAG: hypothetical protein WDA71_02890 [Actinomycetota bacterium]
MSRSRAPIAALAALTALSIAAGAIAASGLPGPTTTAGKSASLRDVVSGGQAQTARLATGQPSDGGGTTSAKGNGDGKGSGGSDKPKPDKQHYLVGAAVQSINPTQAMINSHRVFLGGYGFSSGQVANAIEPPISYAQGRYATGILNNGEGGAGLYARAIAIADGERAIVLAQVDTQGMFTAYKQGPFGLIDIRRDAADKIAKLAKAQEDADHDKPGKGQGKDKAKPLPKAGAGAILVGANHSHGGPDTLGVWGGVPTEYLKLIHDRTVDAIIEAWEALQPVELRYGIAGGRELLSNQFGDDPVNQEVDSDVRVLQAIDQETDEVVVTYVNFSGHPTVLGGDNTKATSDYTGVLSEMVAGTYGGVGFEQVATLGRTQPADRNCPDDTKSGEAADLCRLQEYAERVLVKVQDAVNHSTPIEGKPVVELHSYLMEEPATSPVLLGLAYGGQAIGAPIMRSILPPWFVGNTVGTISYSGRIGDILLSGGPGEMYPQIVKKVRDIVPARGYINLGLAGDCLGYIIGPVEAYPEPIRKSFFDDSADCGPLGCPSPIDNDNYLFNVGHDLGERLTCSLLRGAGEVMAGDSQTYWSQYERCPLFATDLVIPAEFDLNAPASPDLSGVLE